jgi:Mor family transcriptional regulator
MSGHAFNGPGCSANMKPIRHRRATSERNRQLMAEFEAGTIVQELAAKFGVSEDRVRALLRDEKNRREASADPCWSVPKLS